MQRKERAAIFALGFAAAVVVVALMAASGNGDNGVGRYQMMESGQLCSSRVYVLDTKTSELVWFHPLEESCGPADGRRVMIPNGDK